MGVPYEGEKPKFIEWGRESSEADAKEWTAESTVPGSQKGKMVDSVSNNKPATARELELIRLQSILCGLAGNLLLVLAGEGSPEVLLSQIARVIGHEHLERPWVDEYTIAETLRCNLEWNKGQRVCPYDDSPHPKRVRAAEAAMRESLKLIAAQVLGNGRKETNARKRFEKALGEFAESSAALKAMCPAPFEMVLPEVWF